MRISDWSSDVCSSDLLALSPYDVSSEALRGVVSDERVKRFYEARQWRAVWTEDRAEALVAALQDAPRHGLSGDQFRKETAAEDSSAAREAALTFAALTQHGRAAGRESVCQSA